MDPGHPDRKVKVKNAVLEEEILSFPYCSQLPKLSHRVPEPQQLVRHPPSPGTSLVAGIKFHMSPVRKRPGSPVKVPSSKQLKRIPKPNDTMNSTQVYDFIQSPHQESPQASQILYGIIGMESAYGSVILKIQGPGKSQSVMNIVCAESEPWKIGESVELRKLVLVDRSRSLYVCESINIV